MELGKKFLFFKRAVIAIGILLLGFVYRGNPTVLSSDQNAEFFWEGRKIRKEVDTNADGAKDIWITFRGGRPYKLKIDSNKDGRVDVWADYGKDGEPATYRSDTDFDGKIDFSGPYPFRTKKGG